LYGTATNVKLEDGGEEEQEEEKEEEDEEEGCYEESLT
jgi:hypothetical protein